MTSTVPGEKSALTPAAFLLRGLIAGLVAGLFTFAVAFALGEPHVDDAIALEEAQAAAEPAPAPAAEEAEHEESGMVEISRENQKSWGLLTGTLAIGTALGGLTALAAAAVVGRLGGLRARGSTALVALIGFVSIALVPFLKYPATPPAVGDPDTINSRTTEYFGMLLVSVLAAIAAVVIARRLSQRLDAFTAIVVAGAGYLVVVGVTAALLPTVDELGTFPADTLWYFRRSSLLTLATLWGVIGVVLTGLVGKLYDRATADAERRALAASL
ncbi:CbtA family protein [Pimelobacter sp. 30-1]|uniref:CbtA family protein n=1 Tax=Pimelobacter sp. 30-1 TaxID=2004991 RepID=UPI001C05DB50|nr:CbtA family protein [Pimelobacter sp. 30-1]